MSGTRRFLVDEQVSRGVEVAVRKYVPKANCVHVAQLAIQSSDESVYALAQDERRIIITGDRDFLRSGLFPRDYPGHGIIFVQNEKPYSQQRDVVDALLSLHKKRIDYAGKVVLISGGHADVKDKGQTQKISISRFKKKLLYPDVHRRRR